MWQQRVAGPSSVVPSFVTYKTKFSSSLHRVLSFSSVNIHHSFDTPSSDVPLLSDTHSPDALT